MTSVEVKVKDLMDVSETSYQAGMRDGVRMASEILTRCTAKIAAQQGPSTLVEFGEIVAKVLHETADDIHAKLDQTPGQ